MYLMLNDSNTYFCSHVYIHQQLAFITILCSLPIEVHHEYGVNAVEMYSAGPVGQQPETSMLTWLYSLESCFAAPAGGSLGGVGFLLFFFCLFVCHFS